MTFWAFVIYMGGAFGLSDSVSWWRAIFWPFYLGKRIGAEAEKSMPTKQEKAR